VTLDADLRGRVDAAVRERFDDLTEADLRESASTALRFLEVCDGQLGEWRREAILEHAARDEWLMNLPGLLVRAGLVAEAAAVAERAATADPGNAQLFLGDLAQSLGEAGHAEAAAKRAEENLRAFPDQPWVLVTSGFAYAPSDPERAEALFRRAVSVARAGESPSEVEEVYEQYLEFLADQPGREADRQAALRELAEWKRSRGWISAVGEPALTTAPIAKAVKVGRNEPCPCGSGRKFKRCCGA
jgi:tetratricopeptide (TPR) repeat protein